MLLLLACPHSAKYVSCTLKSIFPINNFSISIKQAVGTASTIRVCTCKPLAPAAVRTLNVGIAVPALEADLGVPAGAGRTSGVNVA
jgi:hypothetical protein